MKKNDVRTFFPLVKFFARGLFRFLVFSEGYHGICGCFCPPVTCKPPEIIARLSLNGLQGVLDDFGRKKKPGVAFWGDFGENFIFAIKRHFNHVHLVRTTRNDCQVVPEGSPGGSRQFWWKKKPGGGFLGRFWGKFDFRPKKNFLIMSTWCTPSRNHCQVVPEWSPAPGVLT